MTDLTFVFPKVSELRPQRGSLSSRAPLASEQGCGYLEIPCDFVKNPKEAQRTGLAVGSALTAAAIAEFYDEETGSMPLPYILHTEPSLPRRGEFGIPSPAAPLRVRPGLDGCARWDGGYGSRAPGRCVRCSRDPSR